MKPEVRTAFDAINMADMEHEFRVVGGEQLAPEVFVNTFLLTDGDITHFWDGEKFALLPLLMK